MSVANAITIETARPVAERIVGQLTPACERIMVAGSIRRGSPVVKDVEIVAVAKVETAQVCQGLFSTEEKVNRLHELTDQAAAGKLDGLRRAAPAERCRMPAWGEKQRRLVAQYAPDCWIAVDLFIVTRGAWGLQLALRTGPAEFSKLLVTQHSKGGALPDSMRVKGAQLQYRADLSKAPDDDDAWQAVYVDEEPSFFGALNLKWMPPEKRSVRNLGLAMGRVF